MTTEHGEAQTPDPKKTRTKSAALARRKIGDETRAKKLLEHGWTVISPYDHSIRGPHTATKDHTDD